MPINEPYRGTLGMGVDGVEVEVVVEVEVEVY